MYKYYKNQRDCAASTQSQVPLHGTVDWWACCIRKGTWYYFFRIILRWICMLILF